MNAELAFEIIDPASYSVVAVDLPQLTDRANWLVEKLRDRFPGYQDTHILNWLRTVSGTNGVSNYHFVCTKHAVGLCEHRNEVMTIHPIIIDHFVLIEEGADVSEGEAIYADMKRWAMAIGATEIRINPKSDVPRDLIEGQVGKIVERKALYAKVGK